MFAAWECTLGEISLDPRDLIVVYTDGVTEAPDHAGEEFGEARLVETIRRHADLPVSDLLARIQTAVQQFSEAQADDLTLVIGRAR